MSTYILTPQPNHAANYNPATGILSGQVSNPGQSVSGLTVTIYIDGSSTAAGTATTSANGLWSFTPSVATGFHVFTATVSLSRTATVVGVATLSPASALQLEDGSGVLLLEDAVSRLLLDAAVSVFTVLPAITGTPKVNETLTGYTGNAAAVTAMQFYSNGVAIAGATSQTYTPQASDIGNAITFGVTPSGSSQLVSQPTPVVIAVLSGFQLEDGSGILLGEDGSRLALDTGTPAATLKVYAPYSPSVSTFNQISDGSNPTTFAIADADRFVSTPSAVPFEAYAPASLLVQVWTAGAPLASFTPNGDGYAIGTLNLSSLTNGPRWFEVRAYNATLVTNATVAIYAGFHLILTGGVDANTSALPAGASGLALQFQDTFTTLSASDATTNPGNATWYTRTPYGGDFGDAGFLGVSSAFNPYQTIGSHLRIRSTYSTAYTRGDGSHWYSGLLASAFPDGTASVATGNGYYECRMLIPFGKGTWPAFWLINLDSIKHASSQNGREIDIIEQYNQFTTDYHTTQHPYVYSGGTTTDGYLAHTNDNNVGEMRWEYHRFGALVTGTTITYYFDDTVVYTDTKYNTGASNDAINYMLLNFAMGGGWPDGIPPASYYDLWVDYVRYYA